jgi:hypothetical protein
VIGYVLVMVSRSMCGLSLKVMWDCYFFGIIEFADFGKSSGIGANIKLESGVYIISAGISGQQIMCIVNYT